MAQRFLGKLRDRSSGGDKVGEDGIGVAAAWRVFQSHLLAAFFRAEQVEAQ